MVKIADSPRYSPELVLKVQRDVNLLFDVLHAGASLRPEEQEHPIQGLIILAEPRWDQPTAEPLHQLLYGLFLGLDHDPPHFRLADIGLEHELRAALERTRFGRSFSPVEEISLARRLSLVWPNPWATPEGIARHDALSLIWHILHQQPLPTG